LIQNGGTFNIDNRIELGNVSGSGNEGDYIYHGGVLSSGQNATSNPGTSPGVRLGVGSGTTGKFVDYNNGPAGNITVSGFFISYNSSSTGIVEFHYDNGGIRPIQIVENPNAADSNGVNNSGELSFRNQSSGAQSSRLNLVLDSSPTMTLVGGVEVPQNLGLFTTLDPTKIVGNSGQFKGFYDSTGTNQLPEGAAISLRAPNGYTDTWDISYQGTINFSDPSISAISSITGPNNLLGSATTGGSDVVLMGVSAIAPVIGDANGDGVVNGADLAILVGNNGKSVTGGYAAADFNDDGVVNQDDWSIFDYGVALYNHSVPPVPEPAGAALVLLAPMCGLRRRRR
ncbi:MAG TPA: hypothetical protein VG722_10540, partial [Tepidisphaeraceae bacterium]|nr:hypothetical protein [Tepidisphaeraceae bacterium]